MAAPITPAKKLANGKDHWWIVPTVAGFSSGTITVAEVNAATGLNITGVLLSDYEGLTATTEKVTLPRVMLETLETEINGTTRVTAGDMVITFQPQAATGTDGKKAWEKVKDGYVGYAIRRQDVQDTASDAVTAGQFVDIVPIDIASAVPGKTTTGPDGIYTFIAPVSVTGTPKWNRAVTV